MMVSVALMDCAFRGETADGWGKDESIHRKTVVMHPLIESNRSEILALAGRHGIRDVRVFGSMARGDADDASDVDLLVSLPPDKTGLALGGLLMDVQDLLQRRVEVVTERGLHPALRDRVLREAQPL